MGDTREVGTYPGGASPNGVLDMGGNVREWAADWYDSGYYDVSPCSNPTGGWSATDRVLRGGTWDGPMGGLRVASRFKLRPDVSYTSWGVRCAADAP